MNKLISVIIPTYNREETLSKAINSVFEQTYKNWELIIVDDASTDDTDSLIKQYNDFRIKYFRNGDNRGANYCRNLGAKYAKGEYLAFLDSDNYWLPQKLEKEMMEIEGTQNTIVFCQCKIIDTKNKNISREVYISSDDIPSLLVETNVIDTSATLISHKNFDEAGGFDICMPRFQDWEFFFRAANLYHFNFKFISDCLTVNVQQKNSISVSNYKRIDALLYFYRKYKDNFLNEDWLYHHLCGKSSVEYSDDEMNYLEKELIKVITEFNLNKDDEMYKLWKIYTNRLSSKQKQYELLYQWKLSDNNHNMQNYIRRIFGEKCRIAIYGLGDWGVLIYTELMNLGINVTYGIDRSVACFYNLPVHRPNDDLPKVDYLIITSFAFWGEIKEQMQKRDIGKIVSVEEIVKQTI